MEYNEIIAVIKARRKHLNLSLEDIGKKTGKTKQAIFQLEKSTGANLSNIINICNALDLTVTITEK